MRKFRKTAAKFTAIVMFAIILTAALPVLRTAAAPSSSFSVKLDYAFGSSLQTGYHAPFDLTITNNGSDFEGYVQLFMEGNNSSVCAYEQKLSLPAGATKTCSFTASISSYISEVNIRLVTNKGKEVYNQNHPAIVNNFPGISTIGLLTDDYSALSYLSGRYFRSFSCTTSVYRLNSDTFPSNSKALDLLDVIIIANFATDSLSEEQLSALMKWVNNGGLLIVSTGDSAGKTLSGLDSYINIKTGGLKTYKTTYGISEIQFVYGYTGYHYNNLVDQIPGARYAYSMIDFSPYASDIEEISNPLSDYDGDALYDRIYADNSDIFIEYCWDIYFGDTYINTSYYMDGASLQRAEMDFKEYAVRELIPDFIDVYKTTASVSVTPSSEPVDGIICDFEFGTPLIMGDSADGEDYVFASCLPSGSGQICVLGADITKAPFVNFPENSALLIHIIETLAGQAIYDRMQNYGWSGGNYVLSSLFDKLTSQKLVPLLLYAIVLIAYVIVAFRAFFKFRKKGTSMLIWPFQAGLALAVSLLIFLIGFTTRESGTSVNTVRIITSIGGISSETDHTMVLMPKVKHFELPFKDNYNVTESDTTSRYYSFSGINISKADYTLCVSEAAEGTTIKLNNNSAMGTMRFDLENKKPSAPDIDFSCTYSNGALSGHLTNNSEKTLDDSFICTDFAVFKLKTVLPGETVDLSTLEGVSLVDVKYSNANRIIMGSPWPVIEPYKVGAANLLLGTDNKGFRKGFNKKAAFDYVNISYLSSIPGFGNYYDYINTTIKGTNVSGNCLYVPSRSETEPLSAIGIQDNGFIDTAYSEPVFVAFTRNPEGVLRSKKEDITEILIIADKLNDYTNPDYTDSAWYSYNGYTK